MTTTNQKNFNISTINVLRSVNDALGNVTINNTIKIPYSALNTFASQDNSNACILMKDVNVKDLIKSILKMT